MDAAATATGDGSEKKIVDMAKFTEWFCYDSVAKIAWGKSYGAFLNACLSHLLDHTHLHTDCWLVALCSGLLDDAGGESAGLINDLGAGTILISCLVGLHLSHTNITVVTCSSSVLSIIYRRAHLSDG